MRYYLDHNASSPTLPSVRERMAELLADPPLNAGSVHREGQRARGLVERARRAIVDALGGGGTVVFTSGATEANNLVLRRLGPERALVTSRLEHPSVCRIAEYVEERGRDVGWVAHDGVGRPDLDDLARRADARTVVSLAAANNEIGNLNPIADIAALCRDAGALLHMDAAQVFGRRVFAPPEGVSAITVSAHKFGGPLGVGALWLAPDVSCEPLLLGGAQERGRRAGTENVVAIAGFEAAVRATDREAWSGLRSLRDAFELTLVSSVGAVVNGDPSARLPNTSNLSFPGAEAEALLAGLDLAGVAASAGSACTAGSIEASPVLTALGLSASRVDSAIRFSFGPGCVEDDLDDLVRRVVATVRSAGVGRE